MAVDITAASTYNTAAAATVIPPPPPPLLLFDPSSSLVFLVGVDLEEEWEQPGPHVLDDTYMYSCFFPQTLGLPTDCIEHVTDEGATCNEIQRRLTNLCKSNDKKQTLFVYYGGHGNVDSFRVAGDKNWTHVDLFETIEASFAGSNVIIMADCCYSGNVAASIPAATQKKYLVIASTFPFCNAGPQNTLTQSLIQCPHDTLYETLGYMADEMVRIKRNVLVVQGAEHWPPNTFLFQRSIKAPVTTTTTTTTTTRMPMWKRLFGRAAVKLSNNRHQAAGYRPAVDDDYPIGAVVLCKWKGGSIHPDGNNGHHDREGYCYMPPLWYRGRVLQKQQRSSSSSDDQPSTDVLHVELYSDDTTARKKQWKTTVPFTRSLEKDSSLLPPPPQVVPYSLMETCINLPQGFCRAQVHMARQHLSYLDWTHPEGTRLWVLKRQDNTILEATVVSIWKCKWRAEDMISRCPTIPGGHVLVQVNSKQQQQQQKIELVPVQDCLLQTETSDCTNKIRQLISSRTSHSRVPTSARQALELSIASSGKTLVELDKNRVYSCYWSDDQIWYDAQFEPDVLLRTLAAHAEFIHEAGKCAVVRFLEDDEVCLLPMSCIRPKSPVPKKMLRPGEKKRWPFLFF